MIRAIGEHITENGSFLKMWKTAVDPATRMFQDHRHVNFEIAMVLSGEGVYQTVNGPQPIQAGDVFVFPSNEFHYVLEIHNTGLEIVNLHFNLNYFHTACSIGQQYPNLFFSHSEAFSTRIPAENASEIRQFLTCIQSELSDKPKEYTSAIHSYLNLIFTLLVRHHSYYRPQEGTHTSIEKILKGLEFINTHYCENITLEQIASKSSLSPNYFTALFRQHFKIKLWDYIVSKRIDKAKMLLSNNTDVPMLQIAASCGFHNTANFNKAFIRFTGITPSEYRTGRGKILH